MFSGYVCLDCGSEFETENVMYKCPECGGSLEVVYDYDRVRSLFITKFYRYSPPSHLKYSYLLPMNNPHDALTLGEGGTPLIPVDSGLMVKFEGMNPTGSFKDRGSQVELSMARELGAKEVVCASTGNMGASVSAYAAHAGIKAKIFTPKFAEPIKLKQIKMYGAEVISGGKTYSYALKRAYDYANKSGAYLTGDFPFRLEGQKTVAFEIVDQLNGSIPDNIIIPVGNGTLFYATYKAFKEMSLLGLVDHMPKLYGVEANGCKPLVNAFKRGSLEFNPVKSPSTIAGAINCDAPVDGAGVLRAVYESKGKLLAVSDNDMLTAKKELAEKGLYVEISSASAYAAYKKLKIKGQTILIATGMGWKDPYPRSI